MKALFLKKTKQLDLKRRRKFPDFIKEKRSIGSIFDQAFALGMGAGERAFFVPKEFALQQIFGNAIAVNRDERLFFARTSLMNGEGGQLFPGAALAQEGKRAHSCRQPFECKRRLLASGGFPSHLFEFFGSSLLPSW